MKDLKKEISEMKWQDDYGTFQLKIGMRTGKTMLAILICGLLAVLSNGSPLFAMIASVSCLQASLAATLRNSFNQITGCLTGGLFSVILVGLTQVLGLKYTGIIYYILVASMIAPVVLFTLAIKKPSITTMACIVFIAISLSPIEERTALVQAVSRTADTLIGIAVTLSIEVLMPHKPTHKPEKQ